MGLPSVGDIFDLVKKGATLDAQVLVMRLREEALEIQNENLRLKQRVFQLESEAVVRGSMKYDGEVYWDQSATGDAARIPLCPRCYEKESQRVHLIEAHPGGGSKWTCYSCLYGFGRP